MIYSVATAAAAAAGKEKQAATASCYESKLCCVMVRPLLLTSCSVCVPPAPPAAALELGVLLGVGWNLSTGLRVREDERWFAADILFSRLFQFSFNAKINTIQRMKMARLVLDK